jgi:hypothetical protein
MYMKKIEEKYLKVELAINELYEQFKVNLETESDSIYSDNESVSDGHMRGIYPLNRELGQLSQYSVWLRAGRPRFDPLQRGKDFSSILCIQTGSGAHPASCTMGTGSPFPGAKARPGRDADHSPPSSTEVKNE